MDVLVSKPFNPQDCELYYPLRDFIKGEIRYLFSPLDFLREYEKKILAKKWFDLIKDLALVKPSVFCRLYSRSYLDGVFREAFLDEVEEAWVELESSRSATGNKLKDVLRNFETFFIHIQLPDLVSWWKVFFNLVLMKKFPFKDSDIIECFKRTLAHLDKVLSFSR